jgi:hypothetical protein
MPRDFVAGILRGQSRERERNHITENSEQVRQELNEQRGDVLKIIRNPTSVPLIFIR